MCWLRMCGGCRTRRRSRSPDASGTRYPCGGGDPGRLWRPSCAVPGRGRPPGYMSPARLNGAGSSFTSARRPPSPCPYAALNRTPPRRPQQKRRRRRGRLGRPLSLGRVTPGPPRGGRGACGRLRAAVHASVDLAAAQGQGGEGLLPEVKEEPRRSGARGTWRQKTLPALARNDCSDQAEMHWIPASAGMTAFGFDLAQTPRRAAGRPYVCPP